MSGLRSFRAYGKPPEPPQAASEPHASPPTPEAVVEVEPVDEPHGDVQPVWMVSGPRWADDREYRNAADRFVLSFSRRPFVPGAVVVEDEDGCRWLCAYSRQRRDGSFRVAIGGQVHREVRVRLPEGIDLPE